MAADRRRRQASYCSVVGAHLASAFCSSQVLIWTLCLVTEADIIPPCAAEMGVSHEALNANGGERWSGENCTSDRQQPHERLKSSFGRHRGVATSI